MNSTSLVYRLRKRAEIRRQIPSRKSVLQGEPDRIADLLEEAADYIDRLESPHNTTTLDLPDLQLKLDLG